MDSLGMNDNLASILIGIGGMFGWGIYDFLGGVFARQLGSFKALFWSQLAGLILMFLIAFAFSAEIALTMQSLLWVPVAAVLYSAGYLFFFKGFEIGNVSLVAATMNLWAVFTMLFAFLFMGQRLSAVQTLGVLMIISGVALASVNWRDVRAQKFQLSAGIKEAILGAFFFGVFWNVSEIISEQVGWLFTTLFIKLGIVLFLLAFSYFAKREVRFGTVSAGTKAVVLLMGLFDAGALALVNHGLTIGDAILITPISSALSLVTIALAILFLKDRITKLQGFGIALAIIGIITTAF